MADSTTQIFSSTVAEQGKEMTCEFVSAWDQPIQLLRAFDSAAVETPESPVGGSRLFMRRMQFPGQEMKFVFADSEDRIVRQGLMNAVALLGQDEEPGADDAKRNIQALVDTASRQDLKALAKDLLLSALGSAWHGNPMEVINTAHEWMATLQEIKVSGRRMKRILAAREDVRK